MAKSKGLSKGQLAALCRSELDQAIGYEKTDLLEKRRLALEYYRGEMSDIPAKANRSKVTSRDIADAIGWIMPQLMRSFCGADIVAEYEPTGVEDEAGAKQATEYINFLFRKRLDGYRLLYTSFHDALLLGNGVIKHWWDDSVCYHVERYTGLSEDAYVSLVADDDVEVLEHSEVTQLDPMMGETVVHDLKIRRAERGKLACVAMPPEEFLIDRHAKTIPDARFLAHRRRSTRSELIAEGYDRAKVMSIGTENEIDNDELYLARQDENATEVTRDSVDPMMEEIEVFECYVKADVDGDDYAEWNRVVMAGTGSEASILEHEEWDSQPPFTDIVPKPRPHRWDGESVFDDLVDIQRIKTVLTRQTLDNLYHVNEPMREVVESSITEEGLDQLAAPAFGAVVLVKQPGSVQPIVTPFVGQHSFQMLEYVDQMGERRTGAGVRSAGVDPDALQNQTATAVQATQSQQQAKLELMVRNIGEIGLRNLFAALLEIICKNQRKKDIIRLRNQWVEMDPSAWSAGMDVTVTVGLGTGSKDRDLAMLQSIKQAQEMILMQLPGNPIVSLDQYSNTLVKMIEVSGINNPEAFATQITREQAMQFMQQQAQQPNPEVQKAQMEMQMKQQQAQVDAQIKAQDSQAKLQMMQGEGMMKLELERERLRGDIELQREKLAGDMQLRREQIGAEMQLKEQQLVAELALKRELGLANAAVSAATSNVQMGGEPG